MVQKQSLSTREVAAELGISAGTLMQARAGKGNGFEALPFIKIGRRVIYRRSDVEQFIASHVTSGAMRRGN